MSLLKSLKAKPSYEVKKYLEENLKLLLTEQELKIERRKQLSEFRKGYSK